MEGNGGPERPGHVADELGRNSGKRERLGARQCHLTCARQWLRRWRRGRGSSGEAFGGLAWPEAQWNGQESSPKRGGARCGNGGAKWSALSEWRSRLRHPLGAWWLVDAVGADRRGRQQRTADRWPDTWRRESSVRTESVSESPDCSDLIPKFVDVLLPAHSVVLSRTWSFGQSYMSSTSLFTRSKPNSVWISIYKAPTTLPRNCDSRLSQIRLTVKSALIIGLWAEFEWVPCIFMKSHQHNFCSLWNLLQRCFRCHLHARYLTPVS